MIFYENFNDATQAYVEFLKRNKDMSYHEIEDEHAPSQIYYSSRSVDADPYSWSW